MTTASSRRQADAAWPFGVFLLNGALFVLIGLEVQYVVHEISAAAIGRLVLITLAVWATLLVVRYVFQVLNVLFQRQTGGRPARGSPVAGARRVDHGRHARCGLARESRCRSPPRSPRAGWCPDATRSCSSRPE